MGKFYQTVCPDPHPLRQCNLTVAFTQTNVCICYASFPPMTSHMMSSVWVGDGYLIQTHHRATTPPQTHTNHTTPHFSPSCPASILHAPPPHHSSLSFLPWHQPGSLHELHLYRTISWSVAPQMTLPAARSRSAGPSLHVVLHLGYPITSEKYWCEWGPYIFEITLGGRGKHM